MTELSAQHCQHIIDQLAEHQLCVIEQAFAPAFCLSLLAELQQLPLRQAGIGRAHDQQIRSDVRNDQTCWLTDAGPYQARYLASMRHLQEQLNQHLFLGLNELEAHYACYPAGGFYRRHLDSFRGNNLRRITTTLYLNSDWQDSDGGQLQIYDNDADQTGISVSPTLGRMAVFVSERFAHEVKPAQRPRHSIAGWFRVRE